jgi:cyclase
MQRERISENLYWFQSDVYAQVTAGVVSGPQWAVVIDTLAIPEETLEMRNFIEEELNVPVRYVINTHHHADHTWGNCFFPGATFIAHSLCRKYMIEIEQAALDSAKLQNPIFKQVKIILPHLAFDQGRLSLRVGKKNLVLISTPGNSKDGVSVLVEEDRVLFAGDVFLPVPFVVEGDIDEMIESIKKIGSMGLENIVQGHGDIILRGEIDDSVRDNIAYLSNLKKAVRTAAKKKNPMEALTLINVESCGKSRVLLGGLAEELHRKNVATIFKRFKAEA